MQWKTCNRKKLNAEKLRGKWEGPYLVVESLGNGAYILQSPIENLVEKTWNALNVKRYYQ